ALFFRLLLTCTAGGALLGVLIVVVRPDLLGDGLQAYRLVLVLALLSIPAFSQHGFYAASLAADGRPKSAALLGLSTNVGLMLAVSIGAYLGGLQGLYEANLVACVLLAFGAIAYVNRQLGLRLVQRGV